MTVQFGAADVQVPIEKDSSEPTSPLSPKSIFSARSGIFSARSAPDSARSGLIREGTLFDALGIGGTQNPRGGHQRTKTWGETSMFSKSITSRIGLETAKTHKDIAHEERKAERNYHRERRGLGLKKRTALETFDHNAENIFVSAIEQPWCLQSCMQTPTCQRICFPAEYATRSARKDKEGQGATTTGPVNNTDEQKRFGLPEFGQAGYCLMPPADTFWYDNRVPRMLGLQLAVHRKTSVERLCFVWPKSKLPSSTNKEQMTTLVKSLKRCDHVNILHCYEVCEDTDSLYFLYENFSCITLVSVLEHHHWSQEQLVNLARELCAAVNYASSIGLSHMGWTLSHVLLPSSCMNPNPDPKVAKVHGFGLMGIVYVDTDDRMCWAPEALEVHNKMGDSFAIRMDPAMKLASDYWSLGILIYTLVARRPPILGSPDVISELILARKWAFTLAFDEVDREAKTLVEGLLEGVAERRMKPDAALRNEWIRRRTVHDPREGIPVFQKAEDFVGSPLAKRLFGRFLVRFLDSEHMRKIALCFYMLDQNGDGIVCQKDLSSAAKSAGRPTREANDICDWLVPHGHSGISLTSFAECMAEEVIDGRALRHAFESLDDDGSEEITPEELHEQLVSMDSNLTIEDVMAHIQAAEGGIEEQKGGGDKAGVNSDMKLDFSEFVTLFPVRMKRVQHLEQRVDKTRARADELGEEFDKYQGEINAWMNHLEETLHDLRKLSQKSMDKESGITAVKEMKKHFQKFFEALRAPPGPHDIKTLINEGATTVKHKSKKKKGGKAHPAVLYGYGSYLQDQALQDNWVALIQDEIRALKQAIVVEKGVGESVDHFKAHDAAESVLHKVDYVLKWAKCQFEEYESLLDTVRTLEQHAPALAYSSRGLQRHGTDNDEDDDGRMDDDEDKGHSNMLSKFVHDFGERIMSKS